MRLGDTASLILQLYLAMLCIGTAVLEYQAVPTGTKFSNDTVINFNGHIGSTAVQLYVY